MDKLVILTGPTAVGKTSLSINLAKAINGEIISADSMQVYKGMNIGTAKIRPEEMQSVKHHLIDIIDPTEEFHVVKFKEMVKKAIKEIYEKKKIPIICGGTGFYIQAILYDIDFAKEDVDKSLRGKLEKFADENGNEALHEKLKEVDEASAINIPAANRKRIIRALEFYHQTGKRFSEHNAEQREKISPYNFAYFVLNDDRELLYNRIDSRVDKMMEDGLIDEVKRLVNQGAKRGMTSMDGIGYKEILDYFEGNISLEETIELIKKKSRNYAKRQLTWFRREKEVIWIDRQIYLTEQDALAHILFALKKKGIIEHV